METAINIVVLGEFQSLKLNMNSLQIVNIHKNDPFTKTVSPSDRLPHGIRTKPRGYILNTDPSNKRGSHWVAMYLMEHGKGEYWDSYGEAPGLYTQNFTQFLNN